MPLETSLVRFDNSSEVAIGHRQFVGIGEVLEDCHGEGPVTPGALVGTAEPAEAGQPAVGIALFQATTCLTPEAEGL